MTIAVAYPLRALVDADLPARDQVYEAINATLKTVFPHPADTATPNGNSLVGLRVVVEEASADLQLGVNESYSLLVPTNGLATIRAKTVFGAYHGLQTLSQLIAFDFDTGKYKLAGAPISIQDAPRFPHRGLLIDTSRHFEPVGALLRLVDAMAMTKMNVLHWHMTDLQSFPVASRAHPELAQKGAWSPGERYSWEEMKQIVEHARSRGVRVVPEVDMPGHSASWRKSHPELFPDNCKDWALDPALDGVYAFVKELVADWASIFTDRAFHLGTDEVPEDCWNNARDLAFMRAQGIASLNELFGYFVGRAANVTRGLGKRPTVWDEAVQRATPPKDAVVQVWSSWVKDLVGKALDLGNDVIYSPDPWWYLDSLVQQPEHVYTARGHADQLARRNNETGAQVLGGEVCMWGETVDPSDLDATVWPKAAAMAEQLWSPTSVTAAGWTDETRDRLAAYRCLLLQRGVGAAVVDGKGRDAPPGPGGCGQTEAPAPPRSTFLGRLQS